MSINGILNIYKEKGYTSHDVVAKLRGILKQKKIGHTGTLDPNAQGVLLVCLGSGTKLCDMLTEKEKAYRGVLKLGVITDTQDLTGTVLEERPVFVSDRQIDEAIHSFVGTYPQVPPMYSAVKVNGKKLYELAREGKEIKRTPRMVTIHHITVEQIDLEAKTVTFHVSCSKGTYIRTLCQDIGEKLGCGGCLMELTRTKAGCFTLDESRKLSEIESLVKQGEIEEAVIPVEKMFEKYQKAEVMEPGDRYLYNGNCLGRQMMKNQERITCGNEEWIRICDSQGRFCGIYQWLEKEKRFHPVKMFL